MRALLVDDADDMRFLLAVTLTGAGWEVAEAATAQDALALAAGERFDIALLDARMPGADGFALGAQLREIAPDMPRVLCSAWVDDAVRQRAEAEGFADVVVKEGLDALPARLSRLV